MERKYLLDGLRGLAAVSVLLFHAGIQSGFVLMPSGYLAVDFFFVLSGFVVARAYEGRLHAGWTFLRFAEVRLVRLYPLYLAGAVLGLSRALAAILIGDPRAPSLTVIVTGIACNLALLPDPWGGTAVFPLNSPAWSLSLEVAVNAVFAIYLFRAPRRAVTVFAIAGSLVMVWTVALRGSLDAGATSGFYFSGVGRSVWGFGVGILLHRLEIGQPRSAPFTAAALAFLLLIIFTIDAGRNLRMLVDLAAALLAFPVMVATAALIEVKSFTRQLCGLAGDLSYPLYATHYPLLLPLGFAAGKLGLPPSASLVIMLIVCLGVALISSKADESVRNALSRALHIYRSAKLQVG